jgi:hypothetical protein
VVTDIAAVVAEIMEEGVPGGTIDFRKFSKWRVHARLGFIETANLPSVTTLIR